MASTEETMKESITPTKSTAVALAIRRLTLSSTLSTTSAPNKAESTVSVKPVKTETLPTTIMARAAPRAAPALMPSREGSASGLRKSVCVKSPLPPRAAPESAAVRAMVKRWCTTISCPMAEDVSLSPNKQRAASPKAVATSCGVIHTLPTKRCNPMSSSTSQLKLSSRVRWERERRNM